MSYYFIKRKDASEAGTSLERVYFRLCHHLLGRSDLGFKWSYLKPDWKTIYEILTIGSSALGMTLAGSLSAIVVNRTIVIFGGDMAMSAFGIVNRVIMFAIMPSIVAAQGLQPIIGFNYGAERYDRVIKSIKICVAATTSIGLVVFLFVFFYPEFFVRIFTNDVELIGLSSYAVKRVFAATYLIGFISVGSIVFQALGRAIPAFYSTVTRSVFFLLPAILILPKFIGLDGVWWAFPLSDFMSFVLVFFMLLPVWMEIRRMDSARRHEMEKVMIGETGPVYHKIVS